MGLVFKTKAERRADTPLASTPDVNAPITDIKTALADINKRASDRKEAIDKSNERLNSQRIARSKSEGSAQTGGSKLQGLASLHNTLGRQYMNKPESQNS